MAQDNSLTLGSLRAGQSWWIAIKTRQCVLRLRLRSQKRYKRVEVFFINSDKKSPILDHTFAILGPTPERQCVVYNCYIGCHVAIKNTYQNCHKRKSIRDYHVPKNEKNAPFVAKRQTQCKRIFAITSSFTLLPFAILLKIERLHTAKFEWWFCPTANPSKMVNSSHDASHETLPATGKLSKMKQKGVSLEHLH